MTGSRNTIHRSAFVFACFLCVVLLYRCSSVQAIHGIQLLKGQKKFNDELSSLIQPRGVLPGSMAVHFESGSFITKDPARWNEFFVYTERIVLLILSPAPLYFIKIESEQFFHHLEREYDQIVQGLSGENKRVSSFASIKEVGDFEVGLYFTPQELMYSNSFRIQQIVGEEKPRQLIWHLLEASQEAVVYLPSFEETQLFDDLKLDVAAQMSRLVYTKKSTIRELGPNHQIRHPADFSFIMGKRLQRTNCLLDKQTFFRTDEANKLVRDFIIFFSLPLGTARENKMMDGKLRKDFLDTHDGIAVLYRGNLELFENFFSGDGMNLKDPKARLRVNPTEAMMNEASGRCPAPR